MQVKRFVAPSMQEAVALVRTQFGPEAVILQTRRVRRRGLFTLFARAQYEVVAAVESPHERARTPLPPASLRQPSLDLSRLEADLQEIKDRLKSPRVGEAASADGQGPPHHPLKDRLLSQELLDPLATELVAEVESAAEKPDSLSDPAWVNERLRLAIAARVACVDPNALVGEGRVLPLIGATGVGKTTTIAKLAANFAILGNKRVAVITADTYRIAAVEQLRTYAELIGIPLEVVYSPDEMRQALARHADKEMVLVDTAGRSQRHEMQLRELRAFLSVMEAPRTHLVLSATTKMQDALDIVQRFNVVPFDRLIITKLDETATFGPIYNLAKLTGKRLAYLTNGQNVPDDIEVADPHRIADLIVRGGA